MKHAAQRQMLRRTFLGYLAAPAPVFAVNEAKRWRCSTPPYGLTWSALGAVRKWRFHLGLRDGKPTPINVHIEVEFRAPQRQLLASGVPE